MAGVANRTADVAAINPKQHRPLALESVSGIVLHRLGKSVGEDAADIARAFADTRPRMAGAYTGGRTPYHFHVGALGGIQQLLPLSVRGVHARGYNSTTWAIAAAGDFTKHGPSKLQVDAVQALAVDLALMLPRGAWFAAHTDLPGASSDPNKQCPGPYWPLDKMWNQWSREVENIRELLLPTEPKEVRMYAELSLRRLGVSV